MPRPFARPWLVCTTPGPVISYSSDLPGWEEKIPTLKRQAELNGMFREGTARLDPAEVPERVRLLQRSKRLPDGFFCRLGLLTVTDAVREVVEALDPERH